MNTNSIHTGTSLNLLTLKEITEMVNGFQVELGLKVTKRFATKPAAVKKTLALHAELNTKPAPKAVKPVAPKAVKPVAPKAVKPVAPKAVKPVAPKAVKPVAPKAVKTTLDLTATVAILSDNPKGTIENFIHNAIVEGYDTVASLAGEIADVHILARSGKAVDMKYALRNIKLFADRNSIKVCK